MVNVVRLEERLRDNYDAVLKILLKLGFDEEHIKYRESQHLITAPRPEEGADNPNGCLIYINSLNVIFTTRSWHGNIFSLIMKLKETNFPEALRLAAEWIDYKESGAVVVEKPLKGFYKRLIKKASRPVVDLPIHKESELPSADSLSYRFALDGVAPIVQEKWGVRYDHEDDAILIPIHDYSGNLVGCKARSNDPNCDFNHRFWAYIPYSKSSVIYGWYENFQRIAEKQSVIIVESEKGVLQSASFGCEIVVGIGGHSISTIQARYIKMLGVKTIIVAFDEGISEEEIVGECKKLQMGGAYRNHVKYIYDRKHIVLPFGSKSSPTDFGSEGLKKLLKNSLYEVKNGTKSG